MARAVEEVLDTWREGERLLELLSPLDPDHETVARVVASLRELYAAMTDSGKSTAVVLSTSVETMEAARATLRATYLRKSQRPGAAQIAHEA